MKQPMKSRMFFPKMFQEWVGVGCVIQGWGGSYRGWVVHVGVGWGGSCKERVGWVCHTGVGWGGSCRGGWCGSCRGGVGWVMQGCGVVGWGVGWGVSYRSGVGWVMLRWGVSYRGGVGHVGWVIYRVTWL